jgi:Ribose/xylose/arabinose/galactoside ABC-type transport systems, permease components
MSETANKFNFRKFASNNSALVAVIVLVVVSIILKGTTFLTYANIINILLNNSIIGIIALGMTLIIITGGIDLSVGSQLALTGLIAISVINQTHSIILGILACCALSVALGFVTGGLVAKFSIPAFIVTLGTMTIFRSVAQYIFNGGGLMLSGSSANSFIAISNTDLFGVIPLPIIYWLLLCVIISLFASHTATGRHIYAVGSNEKATRLSSINVDRIKIIAFAVSGLMVAFAAIIEGARLGSMDSASSGSSYEMDAIAAVVIGGTSMAGGRGSIVGTFFGTLIIGIINNMMNLLGVPPFLVGAVKGAIIIIAVLFQKRLDTRAA